MTSLRSEVTGLRADVNRVKTDVADLNTDMPGIVGEAVVHALGQAR